MNNFQLIKIKNSMYSLKIFDIFYFTRKMFRVRIHNAENLPILTKNVRKTRIYCFSTSSCKYFYDSFKNKENTTNPQWNCEFELDLFRCNTLTFLLYSSRLLSKEIFIGQVDINIPLFFLQEAGKQILNNPQSSTRLEFPITSCANSNAILSLSISYFPTAYRPIKFEDISNPVLHIFVTHTPSIPLSTNENPIEIELLQAYFIEDKKSGFYNGLYFNFNKKTQWETIGYSSLGQYIQGQTGLTQIHSISLNRINNKFEFFILDVSDYKGVVTLNFVIEKKGKIKTIKDQQYIEPHNSKKSKKGTLKTVDVLCEPNHKYCFPLYLFYEKKVIKKDAFDLTFSSPMYTICEKPSNSIENYFNEFYSQIIEKAKSNIPQLKDVNFFKTTVLNHSEKVPLINVFNDLNLGINYKLRIYIGGSTSYKDEEGSDTDYWEPRFIIYDKQSCKRNEEIEKSLIKKPFYVSPIFTSKKPVFGMKWNSYVNLNLDQFDMNKVVVFAVYCDASLESADEVGFYLISQVGNYGDDKSEDNERLLFRNLIFPDKNNSHFLICFRFEFIEDGWEIFPMRFYFKKKKKMDSVLNSLFANNWVMPEILSNQINFNDSSGEEQLIENAED